MMTDRANQSPLWKQIEDQTSRLQRIEEKLDALTLNLSETEKIISKLSQIAQKNDILISLVEKIDIPQLEKSLVQLDRKIPDIEPMFQKLELALSHIKLLANELGFEVEVSN